VKVETFPLILGALVGLIGLGLLADAWLPEHARFRSERRRRTRAERRLGGETAIGLGVLCIAAVLIGGDQWHYTTLAIAIAVVLVVIGVALNYRYIRGSLMGPVLGQSSTRRRGDRAEHGEGAPRP
jgi:hypothetical protein